MPLLLAPAKVNLTLEVLARRDDGYHGIRSLMLPIGLFDRLTFEPAQQAAFSCDVPELTQDNIVVRALAAVGAAPARVVLEKSIPHGGGLGGGSSDAAAVLRAAMEGAFERSGDAPDWLTVARSLGSDVPFFLVGTAALVEGTGERVTATGPLPPWWCTLAVPHVAVATAQAYRLLDERRAAVGAPSRPRATSASLRAVEALQRWDLPALHETLCNDFHDLVLDAHPAIAAAHADLVEAGASQAQLSGTGAALFALFAHEDEARAVAARLTDAVARSFVVPLHADANWRTAQSG